MGVYLPARQSPQANLESRLASAAAEIAEAEANNIWDLRVVKQWFD